MQLAPASAEEMLGFAIEAISRSEPAWREALDALPVPVYTTDADGRITYFNRACIVFAGRTPIPGEDMWCVTWKIYTEDGTPLPHDECAMAVAIKERRTVRGIEAIVERPDGTRLRVLPYPTPLYDEDGMIVGAVNMVLDITDRAQVRSLLTQAERCRRLANGIDDSATKTTLTRMAEDYEERARSLASIH
jgi:PAS domain S-box-containing protein